MIKKVTPGMIKKWSKIDFRRFRTSPNLKKCHFWRFFKNGQKSALKPERCQILKFGLGRGSRKVPKWPFLAFLKKRPKSPRWAPLKKCQKRVFGIFCVFAKSGPPKMTFLTILMILAKSSKMMILRNWVDRIPIRSHPWSHILSHILIYILYIYYISMYSIPIYDSHEHHDHSNWSSSTSHIWSSLRYCLMHTCTLSYSIYN